MRIAQVIGTVTLSRLHPSYKGARLKLAVRLSQSNLTDQTEPEHDPERLGRPGRRHRRPDRPGPGHRSGATVPS